MTTRGKWNIVFIAIGVAATIAVFLLLKNCNAPKPDIVAVQDSTQYFKNKYGEVAAIKQREEDFFRVKEAGYLDSIAKLHNTKAKLLLEVTTLKQKGTVTITVASPPIIIRDTLPGGYVEWISVQETFTNPYYNAAVSISLDGSDSSRMKLETFDTLTIVTKTVKEGGLFNTKKYLQVDAVNANPYNRITGLQVYRQPLPKQKKIGIGPFVGYGVSGNALLKPNIVVGVSIQYNFIRI